VKELSLHILDIARNSIMAEAERIEIYISESAEDDRLIVAIRDDGKSVNHEEAESGVPMLKAAARTCGGDLSIKSTVGKGTTIRAEFKLSHMDLPPLGDMVSALIALIAEPGNIQYKYEHSSDYGAFAFTTAEMKEILGDLPFGNPEVLNWLRDFLEEGEESVEREK
jgi:hypothetical protein